MILTLRTDKPEAEIGIYDTENQQIAHESWQAHRALAETLHRKIDSLLRDNQIDLQDLTGIAVYKGPGSFTGLRIGLSAANALAYALEIPIYATSGQLWASDAVMALSQGQGGKFVVPEYGAPVHTTKQKK